MMFLNPSSTNWSTTCGSSSRHLGTVQLPKMFSDMVRVGQDVNKRQPNGQQFARGFQHLLQPSGLNPTPGTAGQAKNRAG